VVTGARVTGVNFTGFNRVGKMLSLRYIVRDVEASITFYTGILGFTLRQQFGPAMAILSRGDISLWIAGPLASASKAMPDGRLPEPGGWNRLILEVTDLPALVADLSKQGAKFRNHIIDGPGGRQILCEDPSGNLVELFEPRR
jgi:catechol 2,3-dioxygenase-like lactoylglutathione lyase family enzyme